MSAANKERLKPPARQFPVVEVDKDKEIPSSVSDYVEKVEKADYNLSQPVQDDQTGQVLITSAQSQSSQITLPISLEEYETGLKVNIEHSLRWLAEWSRRLKKMFGRYIGFKKS